MEIIRPICVDFVSYMTIMTEFFSIRKGKNMLLKIFFFGVSLNAFGQSENTTKPWTYWWWMGSAANYSDITWQMERFAEKGLGGVHIIPIYGVKGYEDQFVPFLSKKWIDLLEHTVKEGRRLGLGVDMTTGTGWPFGGPNVNEQFAAKKWQIQEGKLISELTNQKVKRAAPGGEGLVLDPFGPGNMARYLQRFDSAFAQTSFLPRSMYNDSYEVYGANWTTDFEVEFRRKKGYDFGKVVEILSEGSGEEQALAKMDYLETLAELLLDNYTRPWVEWSRQKGMLTRLQAHGSPANILDVYAKAEIPETESFGTSQFPIPGLRIDPDFEEERFGRPNPLAMKMASSPAHILGKRLVSSETTTWLANHFKVSLSQVKPQIDELFVSGINHIFYHGTTYTPQSEPFPGWLFYASTNYGPHSHFDKHFHHLNSYITRVQTWLQDSKPLNDILLYFPIYDLWAKPTGTPEEVQMLDVHHTERWLAKLPFGELAQDLWKNGYSFDYVSDRQLKDLAADPGGIVTPGGTRYKVILIPESTYMPEVSLDELQRLAEEGAKIVFKGRLPSNATGYLQNEERSCKLRSRLSRLVESGKIVLSHDLSNDLRREGVLPESMAAKGLRFIRKERGGKPFYFVANLSDRFSADWIRLEQFRKGGVNRIDPLSGKEVPLPHRAVGIDWEYFLELLPGQSALLTVGQEAVLNVKRMEKSVELNGPWEVVFMEGKPNLPSSAHLQKLVSWTTLPDSAVYFSGTARYSITFDLPRDATSATDVDLVLGDVREVADVKLNGVHVGTGWSIPFRFTLPKDLLKKNDNKLEIDVTNLSANYMRLVDRVNPHWKKFYDINIVDITYKPFKAELWEPMPSGLLGPVKLRF